MHSLDHCHYQEHPTCVTAIYSYGPKKHDHFADRSTESYRLQNQSNRSTGKFASIQLKSQARSTSELNS